MTTAYDPIVTRYAASSGVPVAYLRALIARESAWNPRSVSSGNARGLMQITGIVLQDFNQHHGTHITSAQLFDPETSIRIGTETLARIVAAYRASGVRELVPDWRSRAWTELLTFGWNAGYSARAGVVFVARALAARGKPVTIDTVSAAAGTTRGASTNLTSAAKVAWCKGVAAAYVAELGNAPPSPPANPPSSPPAAPVDQGDLEPTWHDLTGPAAGVAHPAEPADEQPPAPSPPRPPSSSSAMAPIRGSSSGAGRAIAGGVGLLIGAVALLRRRVPGGAT